MIKIKQLYVIKHFINYYCIKLILWRSQHYYSCLVHVLCEEEEEEDEKDCEEKEKEAEEEE